MQIHHQQACLSFHSSCFKLRSVMSFISCDHIYERANQPHWIGAQPLYCLTLLQNKIHHMQMFYLVGVQPEFKSYRCNVGSACKGTPLVCWCCSSKCQVGVCRNAVGEEAARGCRAIKVHDVQDLMQHKHNHLYVAWQSTVTNTEEGVIAAQTKWATGHVADQNKLNHRPCVRAHHVGSTASVTSWAMVTQPCLPHEVSAWKQQHWSLLQRDLAGQ